eukprot:scaffold114729_cov67-Phaeocystis_antarctica.AAC.2
MELDQGRPTHNGATNADAVHVNLEEAVVALAAVEDLRMGAVIRMIREDRDEFKRWALRERRPSGTLGR